MKTIPFCIFDKFYFQVTEDLNHELLDTMFLVIAMSCGVKKIILMMYIFSCYTIFSYTGFILILSKQTLKVSTKNMN